MPNGKFINTKQNDNINRLVFGLKDIIKNPYYKYINSTPTPVDYLNINIEMSTLDEGAKIAYDKYGKDSPIVHNLIKDFMIYGLEKIQIQMENGDFGAESSSIEGEAVILPGTIIPYVGDLFQIKYLKEKMMFIVNDVTFDTLENGANFYKIRYELDSSRDIHENIHIKDRYHLIFNNIGTKFNAILREEKYDLIEKLDDTLITLKRYYKSLFYSSRVQTLIFKFHEEYFYDPYMIEFISRHELLDGDGEFIYVTQMLPVSETFIIDYAKSFFYFLENGKIENIRRYKTEAIGRFIDAKNSIFNNRPENYFMVDFHYNSAESRLYGIIPCISDTFIQCVETLSLLDIDNPLSSIYNPIIKFLFKKGDIITQEEIDNLEFLDYNNNVELFYGIPILIYCLEHYIKDMMIKPNNET